MDRDSRDRTDDFVVTNDFVVKVATVNGTGSASANSMLMQAIFRMGIPVSGKNVFPSNIQGLPTWYEIRVNKHGHLARSPNVDLMLAMNPKTYEQDIKEVRPGGAVIFDSSWPLDEELLRADVMFFGVPLSHMCVENFKADRERTLMKNIAYVGAVAALLAIDLEVIEGMLEEKFSAKQHLMDSNNVAIRLGYDYAMEHFDGLLRIRLEAMDANRDSVLMTGNMAAALGCVYAGATVGAWYPITPATSLMDSFRGFCARLRKDPETGKNLYCIIQAEDELAAIGMVLGAGWMGARAFTPTSGAGLSLMNELLGMAYYAEIPAVIFDVQREGPSTGMPTRTQQGDFFTVAFASHGDTKHILLFPGDPRECFYFSVEAFDLAERFQTPVFVVSDLDIGMNDWCVRESSSGMMPTCRTVERFYPRRIFRRWRCSIGTSTSTATVSPLGLFRGSIPRGRTSPGGRGTTVSVATPKTPISTETSWTGSRGRSKGPRRPYPLRRSASPTKPPSGSSRSVAAGRPSWRRSSCSKRKGSHSIFYG